MLASELIDCGMPAWYVLLKEYCVHPAGAKTMAYKKISSYIVDSDLTFRHA